MDSRSEVMDIPETPGENGQARLSLDDRLLAALLWALGLIVFAQFFSRYVIGNALGWTEEAARYLLIWLTFLGAATAVKRRSHIVISFFYRYIPVPACRAVSLCIDLVMGAFCLVLAWQSYLLTKLAFQAMSSIPLPKAIIYYGTMLFFIIMAVQQVHTGIRSFKGKELCPLVRSRLDYLALQRERRESRPAS